MNPSEILERHYDRELYDRIFASTDRDDIIIVYEALQRASNEKHLPAFERCAR